MDFTLDPFRHVMGSFLDLEELSRLARQNPSLLPVLRQQLTTRLTEALRLIPVFPQILADLYTEQILNDIDLEVYVRQAISTMTPVIISTLIREEIITIDDVEDIADMLLANGYSQLHRASSDTMLSLVDLLYDDYTLYRHSLAPIIFGSRRFPLPLTNNAQSFEQIIEVAENLHRDFERVSQELLVAAVDNLADTLLFSMSDAFLYIENDTNPVGSLLLRSIDELLQPHTDDRNLINSLRTIISDSLILRHRVERLAALLRLLDRQK